MMKLYNVYCFSFKWSFAHNRVGGEVQSLVISSQISFMGKNGKMSNLVEDSPVIINFQFQLVNRTDTANTFQ